MRNEGSSPVLAIILGVMAILAIALAFQGHRQADETARNATPTATRVPPTPAPPPSNAAAAASAALQKPAAVQ